MTARRADPSLPQAPDGPSGSGEGDLVAGLAREVEALRRTVTATAGTVEIVGPRVDELARLVEQLTGKVAALAARARPDPARSWLLAPTDPAQLADLVDELCAWLAAVWLRYSDAAQALPECWLRHPDIVEELVWLMHAWCAAYQGDGASVARAADWHDRYRPAVVRRIRSYALRGGGPCSFDQHRTRADWDQTPAGAVAVPGLDEVAVLAGWWATGRDDPAPEPDREAGAQIWQALSPSGERP